MKNIINKIINFRQTPTFDDPAAMRTAIGALSITGTAEDVNPAGTQIAEALGEATSETLGRVQASTFGKQLINQPSKRSAQAQLAVPLPFAAFNLLSERYTWLKAVKFTSTKTTAISATVKSSTGYAMIMNYDGTYGSTGEATPNATAKVGSVDPDAQITVTGRAPASPFNTRLPKFYAIYPCDASGNLSGDLTYLALYNNQLTSIDVTALSELTYLSLSSNLLTSIDVTGLSELTYLGLSNNQITGIDLTGLSVLNSLSLNNNQLTSIDLTGLSAVAIVSLTLTGNQLTSIDVTGLSVLETLHIGYNQLTSIDLTGLSVVRDLRLNNNQLTSIDLTGLSAVTILDLGYNQLTSIDLTGLSAVANLQLSNNLLTSFVGTGLSTVTYLNLSGNQLTSFDGTGLSAVTTVILNNNQFTSIDLTGLSALFTLNLESNLLTSFVGTDLSEVANLYLSNNSVSSVLLPSFTGTSYYTSYNYGLDLSNLLMTTDAVWAMLDAIPAPAIDQPYPINLTGNPCDGAGPSLVEDGVHTQAEIEALLTAKGYSLQLTDGTIAP
jgi:Leucine-rich repeat (LRR) protein